MAGNKSVLMRKIIAEDFDAGIGRVLAAAPSGGQIVGHRVNITAISIAQYFSNDFGIIQANAIYTLDVSVPGAAPGYPVLVGMNSTFANGHPSVTAFVTAPNTVRIELKNLSTTTPLAVNFTTGTICVLYVPDLSGV